MKRLVILTMLIVAATIPFSLCLPGCNEAQIAEFKLAMAQAEADLAQVQADVAGLPEGPEKEKAKELVKLIEARIESMNKKLLEVEDTPGLILATSQEIGTVVPAPYGSWIALAGVALAGIWRASRAKAAARNIAATVDKVLTPEQKRTIKDQTPLAKALVDEATGKTSIKIPI